MFSLVLFVMLIGAVIAVTWLIVNPRPPAFRLNSLSLSLTLSGLHNAFDASSPPPKLHVRIQLTATNPNKKLDVLIQDVNLCFAPVHRKCHFPLSSHNDTSSSEYDISKRRRRVLTFEGKAGLRPGDGKRRKRPFQFTVETVRMKVSIKFMHAYWPSECRAFLIETHQEIKRWREGLLGSLRLIQQKLMRKARLFIVTLRFSDIIIICSSMNLLAIIISFSLKNGSKQCRHRSRKQNLEISIKINAFKQRMNGPRRS
ncbi:hypothetical protein ACJRO7_003504 [Eucalyptus globulus]|uniref:Late embryogenesis abundant protein LEA-2 subgroup domain-containing protein n=1 Tax=Eucalyptus globulus TaxID=34317 RepID=A0ABD3IVZ4_EUCGL